jgi:hypothetical protein
MATRKRLGHYEARGILAGIGCEYNADFHRLDSNQVNRVIMEADQYGYRAPKKANGSRARYFFAYLQRAASRTGA